MNDPSNPITIEAFTLGPFETNCYLVHAGGPNCWIIDASFGPAPIVRRIHELGKTPATIILTHAHVDHIAGLAELRDAYPSAPILIHQAERDFLADPVLNLSAALGEHVVAPPADRLLADGETLELDGSTWRVLHTPGHSPGGITLISYRARIALVGDTLFAGSIGRFDFPTSDGPTLFDSIRRRLYTLPDDTRALPGHGPETTIGREKHSNPFVKADEHV